MGIPNAVLAIAVGAGWVLVLTATGQLLGVPRPVRPDRSMGLRDLVDSLYVGGGTGVMLYLTQTRLGSFLAGMAGMVAVGGLDYLYQRATSND